MTPPVVPDQKKPSMARFLTFPPPARNPFVQVLTLGALVQGVNILAGHAAPGSTEAVLPHGLLLIWGAGLIAFWALLAAAAVWRNVGTGVLIEGLACGIGLLATSSYAVGAFNVMGWGAFVWPVLTTMLYGPACAVRLCQIVRAVRSAHRVLQEIACPPAEG